MDGDSDYGLHTPHGGRVVLLLELSRTAVGTGIRVNQEVLLVSRNVVISPLLFSKSAKLHQYDGFIAVLAGWGNMPNPAAGCAKTI